eukprot:570483-Prymnesium_polylepis.1
MGRDAARVEPRGPPDPEGCARGHRAARALLVRRGRGRGTAHALSADGGGDPGAAEREGQEGARPRPSRPKLKP